MRKKRYLILLILLVGGIVAVQLCLINYRDVWEVDINLDYNLINQCADNNLFVGMIDARNVIIRNKTTQEEKRISLNYIPDEIALGEKYIYLLQHGDNYASKEAKVDCYDYDCNLKNTINVFDCNSISTEGTKIFFQYWLNDEQDEPFVSYGQIIANAWLDEDEIGEPVKVMTADKNGMCKVGTSIFRFSSRGYFTTQSKKQDDVGTFSYVWTDTEELAIMSKKLLESKVEMNEKYIYRSDEYYQGKYLYGVLNIWEKMLKKRNSVIPANRVIYSYSYKINTETQEIEYIHKLDKGCVGLVSMEEGSVYFKDRNVIKYEMQTEKKRKLCKLDKRDFYNIILQEDYLLVKGDENRFISFN